MDATTTRLTADQYYELTVEGDRKQLVEGEVVVDDPKAIHAHLQARLCHAVFSWIDAGTNRGLVLTPTDIRLDEHNVFGPDLSWFAGGHEPADLDAYPDRIPDLCVEIRSDGTWRYDIGAKKGAYERAGLPELWLVDHAADSVLIYRRSVPDAAAFDVALELGRKGHLTSPQLAGFALAIDELFRR